jgi:hypothetical protein
VLEKVPFELVEGIAFHSPREYANLAVILPRVYEENVNVIDDIADFSHPPEG